MNNCNTPEERVLYCIEHWTRAATAHEMLAAAVKSEKARRFWLNEAAADRHEADRLAARLAQRPAA